MSVDRLPQTRYFSGKEQQQRAARENLKFILANLSSLKKVRGGEKLIEAAQSMSKQKENLTDNQINYIANIYEKVFKGAGYDSAPVRHDKRKTLRY
jgi:cytochrome c553